MKGDKYIHILSVLLLFSVAGVWLFYLKAETGIHWDEPWQQNLGAKSYAYATGESDKLLHIQNRYHGGSFETLAEWISRKTHSFSFTEKVKVRRTVLVFFFLAGALALYFAALELTRKSWAGLLSWVVLFCTPRIMAHAAFNTKDIPVLAAACIFLWSIFAFKNRPGYLWAIVSAGSCALMISLRIPAVYTLLIWGMVWLFKTADRSLDIKKAIGILFAFGITATLATVLFWPVLWHKPMFHFVEAWRFMSRFPWDNPVLFMGSFYQAADLPWYYIPFWVIITVPPLWLIGVFSGMVIGVVMLWKRKTEPALHVVVLMAFVLIPVLAVIMLKSVVYDEWRHVFFIYPGMILLVVYGVYHLLEIVNYKKNVVFFLLFLAALQIAEFVLWSSKNKEYTYLYFNPVFRSYACGNMEQDYWGLSYKQANSYLLELYKHEPLHIGYVHTPGIYNFWNLHDSDKAKLRQVPYHEVEYLITNHRFEKESFNFGKLLFSKTVNGCTVFTIYHKPHAE